MFKIVSNRLVWIALKWPGVAEDGSTVQNEMRCQVELVDRSEVMRQQEAEMTGEAKTVDWALQRTKDWAMVGDERGNPLPFTPQSFRKFLECPGTALAWGSAYTKAWNGISEIREGNSESSPVDGQAGAQTTGQPPAA